MQSVSPTVYTVTELNGYVKSILDNNENLAHILVKGEISNFKNHYSGHLYMTIKDEGAQIKAVMFSSYASRLRFVPENGMTVIIFGSVSLYNKDGSYQFYITDMQPFGVGALNLAYEQLKEKLQKEGLFEQSRKKKIPEFPEKIGVLTAPDGAAVKDIFSVLKRRYPVAEIIFHPVAVQGASAAPEIAKGIKLFNELNGADVLIVGRGGGSLEDLWAFNEEITARAIAQSEIPVISAVGHETDYTISDFVADLRAPTPSAAAELCVPDITELKTDLYSKGRHLNLLIKGKFNQEREILQSYKKTINFLKPQNTILNSRQEIANLQEKSITLILQRLNEEKSKLSLISGKLEALSPLAVLKRGYAIAYKDNIALKSINDIKVNDKISLKLQDGELLLNVEEVK